MQDPEVPKGSGVLLGVLAALLGRASVSLILEVDTDFA